MMPRRKVPVVRTTRPAAMKAPSASTTPVTSPLEPSRTSSAAAVRISSPSTSARNSCIARRYSLRSAWARGPRTAGPLLRLRTRNWMPARSIARPMTPSSASISRTRWPLARPPIAGLHDISPIVSIRWVKSSARAPRRAEAAAASQPAWPPPMTMTSYEMELAISRALYAATHSLSKPDESAEDHQTIFANLGETQAHIRRLGGAIVRSGEQYGSPHARLPRDQQGTGDDAPGVTASSILGRRPDPAQLYRVGQI